MNLYKDLKIKRVVNKEGTKLFAVFNGKEQLTTGLYEMEAESVKKRLLRVKKIRERKDIDNY